MGGVPFGTELTMPCVKAYRTAYMWPVTPHLSQLAQVFEPPPIHGDGRRGYLRPHGGHTTSVAQDEEGGVASKKE